MYISTNNTNQSNFKEGSKFVSLVYALSPIMVIYASPVPGLAINELLIVCLFIWYSISNPKQLFRISALNFPLILFILYGVCITFYVIITQIWAQPNVMIYDLFSKFLFLIIFLVGVQFVSLNIFINYVLVLANISVTFLFLQYALSLIGIHISGILPFLPLSNDVDTSQFISGQLGSDRFSSIFSEPAHLSEFLLLPFAISFFSKKKSLLRILLYGIAIMMSKSTTGFSVLGVLLAFYLVECLKNIKRKSLRILATISVVGLIIAATPIFLLYFGDRLDRFSEISGDGNGLFSGYIRVMRGYVLYGDFDLFGKLFGQGFGCILGYIDSHNTSYLELTDKIPEYVNSIQYLLITTGIIGFGIIAYFLIKIYIQCSLQYKMVMLTLVIMMASSTIFFSTIGCLYLVTTISSLGYKDSYPLVINSKITI